MIIRLSYPLVPDTPLYPGTPPVVYCANRSIAAGDSASSHLITAHNHAGTHIDTPSHFCREGATVAGCLEPETVFYPCYCIDIAKQGSSAITVHDLADPVRMCSDAEAILLRTGGFSLRGHNPARYSADHPYIATDIPAYLREHCRKIRLVGLDQISVSSTMHREEGRKCHAEFLCGNPPILLLEDLDLSDNRVTRKPFRLRIYPHIIAAIDATPVTAVAEMEQEL